jgi:hypothetical protein
MRHSLVLLLLFAACDSTSGRDTTTGTGSTGGTTAGTNGATGATNGGTGSTGGTTGGSDGGWNNITPGGTTGTTGNNNCGVQNFTLQHGTIPELLIVQDRSGSMDQDPMGNPLTGTKNPQSKWMQIVNAIEQVVQATGTIQWGLLMFPDVKTSSTGTGCEVPMTPDVPVAAMTGTKIKTALDGTGPDGLTPTAAAINAAVASYTSKVDPDGHPKYLLLATDGEPNCGTGTGGFDDTMATVKAISDAAGLGFHTFVVGIGETSSDDMALTQMANAGLEPDKTAGQKPYYQVASQSDLVGVLTKIAGQLVSCSYALTSAPMSPDLVTIQAGSKTIPRDMTHMNGWDYGPMNMSIIFYGSACMDLQTGITQSVSAIYGCPPVS